ncbi:MAG: MarC family protein [Methanomassiliicoccales archaeon]
MEGLDQLIYSVALLFFIFDPFASLPIFISLTKNMDDKEKEKSALYAIMVAATLFVIFTLLGTAILDLFGISLDAFRIAGGLVLLLMAIEIVFSLSFTRTNEQGNVAWVIVATPILTGPGVISTAILLTSRVGWFTTIIAGVISLAITWGLLRNSILILRKVGTNTIEIFSKIIGLLLAALAVEFILQGIHDWIGTHPLVILFL